MHFHNPKVSLIIPTRNGGKYVTSTIDSILSQSYSNVEVIVSVNYSTDNTLEVLGEYKDSRLKVVMPPQPLSMAAHYDWCLTQAWRLGHNYW